GDGAAAQPPRTAPPMAAAVRPRPTIRLIATTGVGTTGPTTTTGRGTTAGPARCRTGLTAIVTDPNFLPAAAYIEAAIPDGNGERAVACGDRRGQRSRRGRNAGRDDTSDLIPPRREHHGLQPSHPAVRP